MVDEKINKTSSLGLTVSCCYNHQLNINIPTIYKLPLVLASCL